MYSCRAFNKALPAANFVWRTPSNSSSWNMSSTSLSKPWGTTSSTVSSSSLTHSIHIQLGYSTWGGSTDSRAYLMAPRMMLHVALIAFLNSAKFHLPLRSDLNTATATPT